MHRSKQQAFERIFRQADPGDGIIRLEPKDAAKVFGWSVRRAEKFLSGQAKPTDSALPIEDKFAYLPKEFQTDLPLPIEAILPYIPDELQEQAKKGVRLFQIDTNVYYVIEYPWRKCLHRLIARWKYRRRWDRKHRPSGHKAALKRHPKPPPIRPDAPGYIPLTRKRPCMARPNNQNAKKKRPQRHSARKHPNRKDSEA